MSKLSGVADVKNTIRGGSDSDVIIGGNLADRLYGNAGDDIINGGAGNDYIHGGNGHSEMDGGAGNDTIVGGTGLDKYTFNANEGNDTIIDRGGTSDSLYANFITSATSGVFIKRGNDLIVAEGTVNNLSTEIATVQGLGTLAARKAGMRTIVNNLSNSVTIKNYFGNGEIERPYASGSAFIYDQTIAINLVDYNTGLKYFNQAVTNADIVRGTTAPDHIIASKNSQVLKGGKGDDVYYIDANTDVVIEDSAGLDKIIFDDNNGGANVYTYTKEANNIRVTFDDGSGAVVASAIIKNFYSRNGVQIESIGSDDDGDISAGVVYDATSSGAICDKLPALTSATKVLRGSIVDDNLTVAAGQTAYGRAGDDEYTVTAGKTVIVDSSGNIDTDKLNADHVAVPNDAVLIKRGNDLIILDGQDDPDGAGGYATADDAVTAMLASNNISERRTILRTLTEMNDSVTIRNHFSNGTMETIKALNNASIGNAIISADLVDYSTGLKYFNQDANTKIVRGTVNQDYITATADGQKIYGGNGNDYYYIPGGFTDVEIHDTDNFNIVTFSDADLDGADSYEMLREGKDLRISVTDAVDGDSSVIYKNYFKSSNSPTTGYLVDQDFGFFHTFGLYGTSGDDTITIIPNWTISMYGNAGNDVIYGNNSSDTIYGGDGNDTINGGFGLSDVDSLYGGEGSDVYEVFAGDVNDKITEEDATADDTDKIIFKGVDFTSANTSLNFTRGGNHLTIAVTDADSIISSVIVQNHYAVGSSRIEVIEDGYGNVYNDPLTFNASVTHTFDNNAVNYLGAAEVKGVTVIGGNAGDFIIGSSYDDTIQSGDGADTVTGDAGNDSIEGGDGADMLSGGDGNDWIDAGAGDDLLIQGDDGNDTIIGGLGDDPITLGADNDVALYDLDSGTAAGADTISDFTIGEDVVRFTTSANDILGLDYRNHIAIRDTGVGLEIGYGWDEAAQDYANTITFAAYDDASALTDNVIEFVTADGTTALTAAEITAILADIAADGDAPGTLAAVHDDIDAGAGGNDGQLLVDSINTAW